MHSRLGAVGDFTDILDGYYDDDSFNIGWIVFRNHIVIPQTFMYDAKKQVNSCLSNNIK